MSAPHDDPTASLSRQVDEALRRRDAAAALRMLDEALTARPHDVGLTMQKAVALRVAGDFAGALQALDAALAIEPYNFVALLAKGAVTERLMGERHAADVYRNALKIAPVEVPPNLQAAMKRAREVIAGVSDALETFLRQQLAAAGLDSSGAAKARADEAVRIFAGKQRAYHSEALLLQYPRLPAVPFLDRELFPWLPELEAATSMIREELEAVLRTPEEFAPYVAYPAGTPVNQWGELNHSRRWSSYFLWRDGERQGDACLRCPRTSALVDGLPLARQPMFAPTVVFSALEAHTHIPAHTGSTNARALVHLPLILPGPARFRVGGETRAWRLGEAWVFDDTIEHEAWNDADQLRVILILDVWNPYLEPVEREMVTTMLMARAEFLSGNP
jgi:aspartyl/asparaginyl beta-hydroxylase (cupin superfamily)